MSGIGDFGGTLFISIIVIILIVALIYLIIHYIRKRREARIEHIELYFGEHFRDIMKEWDLQTRPKVKDWSKNISKRLDTVGKDIDGLTKARKSIDTRLNKLDREIEKLEIL